MKKVLVVDDEEALTSLVRAYLEKDGYRVVTAADGQEGLEQARRFGPDLVILDVMMPVMDGLEFLRAFRRENPAPVILLTARVEEIDRVLGLELGADDYLVKPFFPRELVSRVRAVLRRAQRGKGEGGPVRASGIELDPAGHSVTAGGQPLDLTPTEFQLLQALLSAPGRVFTRLDLLEAVQGTRYEGYERTIDLHIKNLRAKLSRHFDHPLVETVYGVGYRFTREDA